MNAWPAKPTNASHESLFGALHKISKPRERINTLNTNIPLVGREKRIIRKLDRIEESAFCLRINIPCGVKNKGTINQNNRKKIMSITTFAANGLKTVSNPTTKDEGMNKTARIITHNTDSNTVWTIERRRPTPASFSL